MAKNNIKNCSLKNKRLAHFVVALVVVSVLVVIGIIGWFTKLTSQQSETSYLKYLITLASDNLLTDAPVDIKTGDTYFPPSGLMVPYSDSLNDLTYTYDVTDPNNATLSVSKQTIAISSQMHLAQNIKELFEKLPTYQACQRGVKISYKEIKDESNIALKHTVKLKSGKTANLHTDSQCPELDRFADSLKNIQEQ
jgi:hypothetical protein